MAKKSIKQDLILRGLDPNNVMIGENGLFVERTPVAVISDETQPSGSKNALVELAPEEVAQVTVSVVESVEAPVEIVSEEPKAEDAVEEKVEEKTVVEEAVEAEATTEPSEAPSSKKNKSKK